MAHATGGGHGSPTFLLNNETFLQTFSCVLENRKTKISSPASIMEAPVGDAKYSTIFAPSLYQIVLFFFVSLLTLFQFDIYIASNILNK